VPIAGFLLALLFASASAVYAQSTAPLTPDATCAGCHDSHEKLKTSAHGAIACASCHLGYNEEKHPEGMQKPACQSCHAPIVDQYNRSIHAVEARKGTGPDCASCHGEKHEIARAKTAEGQKAVPDTCGMCHDKELAAWKTSIHGKMVAKGMLASPVCTGCHSPHLVVSKSNPESRVNAANIPDTCGRCHGNLQLMARFGLNASQVTSFKESFHGLALKSGLPTVAECASCHGYHTILPSSDPKSSIHPKNIAATCGSCHPGAGSKFQLGRVHEIGFASKPVLVQYTTWFYWLMIPGTIGFMFLHQAGDFLRKLTSMRFQGKNVTVRMLRERGEDAQLHFRMHRFERIQHILLAVSFMVLAHSGFALHYPNEWWSRPFLQFESTYPLRGLIHRTAAVVMCLTGLLHVWSLVVNRKLREHWMEMLPKVRDLREMVEGSLYRLGLRRERPYQSAHSYIEKAEYWALVWGTVVMAGSGVLLWFNNWTLSVLPKVAIDFARTLHYYEAVLATLAILVWHFYTVIFDPDVYPMDPSWLTGYTTRPLPEHQGGHASADD
jgi:cytochrome b subunit of formate dehydrogenase